MMETAKTMACKSEIFCLTIQLIVPIIKIVFSPNYAYLRCVDFCVYIYIYLLCLAALYMAYFE